MWTVSVKAGQSELKRGEGTNGQTMEQTKERTDHVDFLNLLIYGELCANKTGCYELVPEKSNTNRFVTAPTLFCFCVPILSLGHPPKHLHLSHFQPWLFSLLCRPGLFSMLHSWSDHCFVHISFQFHWYISVSEQSVGLLFDATLVKSDILVFLWFTIMVLTYFPPMPFYLPTF